MSVYFESRKNGRQNNQDHYLFMEYRVNHEAMIRILLVADGMGGLSHGGEASEKAARKWILKLQEATLSKNFQGRTLNEQIEYLKTFSSIVMKEINSEIYREFSDKGYSGGTTLTAAIIYWDRIILSNCGDSPAYLYHKKENQWEKVSKDHNQAEELLRLGRIEKNSIEYLNQKHLLTDYLGKYKEPKPYVTVMPFMPGDKVMIGSDGAFGNLIDDKIFHIIQMCSEEESRVIRHIMDISRENGEEDNQTLIYYLQEEREEEKHKSGKWSLFHKKRKVRE